jgi:hypothetical protein
LRPGFVAKVYAAAFETSNRVLSFGTFTPATKERLMKLKITFIVLSLHIVSAFGQENPKAPPGWGRTGDNPDGYEFVVDTTVRHGGKASISIKPKPTAVDAKFGSLVQAIRPDEYRGKRIRFSGYIKTENIGERVSLWVRVDGPGMRNLDFSNMDDRPIKGTTEWRKYDLVVDVPSDAVAIVFGAFLVGKSGQAWLDDLQLEPVGSDVAKTSYVLTEADRKEEEEELRKAPKEEIEKTMALYRTKPTRPVNLDFEQTEAAPKKQ